MILHASLMDDPALEAVIEHGAAICPTFTFLTKATAAMIRRAYNAGVPIL